MQRSPGRQTWWDEPRHPRRAAGLAAAFRRLLLCEGMACCRSARRHPQGDTRPPCSSRARADRRDKQVSPEGDVLSGDPSPAVFLSRILLELLVRLQAQSWLCTSCLESSEGHRQTSHHVARERQVCTTERRIEAAALEHHVHSHPGKARLEVPLTSDCLLEENCRNWEY